VISDGAPPHRLPNFLELVSEIGSGKGTASAVPHETHNDWALAPEGTSGVPGVIEAAVRYFAALKVRMYFTREAICASLRLSPKGGMLPLPFFMTSIS
jgi:hypothetical protein